MAKGKNIDDLTTLEMALIGYQIEKQKIEEKIRELQSTLKGKPVTAASAGAVTKASRQLSPAARRRISLAQKKRWAEHRKLVAQQAKQ